MSHISNVKVNGGYVSTGTNGRDAARLQSGELVSMKGSYYRKNDPEQAWKMPGRSLFGNAGSGRVKGVAICQFDEGASDKLIASVGTSLVAATPGSAGTFTPLVTGLNPDATVLTACHQDDRWYIGNGYDDNIVLMPDGTTRPMGMHPPSGSPTVVSAVGTPIALRPTTSTGTNTFDPVGGFGGYPAPRQFNVPFYDTAFVFDALESTYAVAYQWSRNFSIQDFSGFTVGVGFGRTLNIVFTAGTFFQYVTNGIRSLGVHVSLDAGASFPITAYAGVIPQHMGLPTLRASIPVDDLQDAADIVVRVAVNKVCGDIVKTEVRVYDINIQGFGVRAPFDTDLGGIYYAITEGNVDEDIQSGISGFSELVEMTAQNYNTITRPPVRNPHATHWFLYRTVDGAAKTKENLGHIKTIPISETTVIDDFIIDKDTQALPTFPLVSIGDTSYDRDGVPTPFISMVSWNGSICGISRTEPRTWFYSEAGRPESFPIIYQVISFPLEEHDSLVGQMPVGETMVLLCKGAALAVDDTPRATDGNFNGASARPIKGHPGCTGFYAYQTFSVAGEPRGAWVSPFGVYITNGQVCACISTDLSWEYEVNVPALSTAVLKWDQKNQILWFQFDSNGDGMNDREIPFHMAEAHSKGESRPKLGEPTPKATSCMAAALIDSAHYRFSGHPSNGSIYIEEVGTVDASTGNPVEMVLKTSLLGSNMVDVGILKATVNHTDFGTGQTGSLVSTLYRHTANSHNQREQRIRLDGNRGTTVAVNRAGQLADFTITYSGPGSGAVGDITLEIEGQGRSGSAPRWVSVSATP